MSDEDYILIRAAYACLLTVPVDVAMKRREQYLRTCKALRDAIAKHSGIAPWVVQTEFEKEAAQ